MRELDADILIIGGGPAGAWAARCLARAGASVRLLDASHPREKPCGGGLTERCVAMVGGLLASVPHVAIDRVRFEAPPTGEGPYPARPRMSPSVTVPVPRTPRPGGRAPLVVVSRRDFDGALINAARDAGAEIVEERVVDVEAAPEAVTVRTRAHRFHARFLIGADGALSLVRRRLHHPFPATHWSLATGVFARGATSQEMVVRFVRDPPGYIWSFPRADHLAIGICAPADSTDPKALRSHLDRWLARQDLTGGRTLAPYTWPIPTLPFDAWADGVPVGDRWLLAGDAAGLVDPLTREGIYYALRSGELAAGALLGSAASPSRAYAASVRDEFITELVKSARARRTFFSPLVTRLWIDVLQESPRVRDLALQVVIGTVGYHHIRRRAVGAIEASAAARVAGRQIRRGLGLAP